MHALLCHAVLLCTAGEGKPRMLDEKETTVYKRALDMSYNLKIKSSRAVYGEVRSAHAAAAAAACEGSPVLSWAACSRCCALFRSYVSCGVVAGHVALCQLG